MQISREEYTNIISRDTILSFNSDLAKNIFLFYQEKKSQTEYYSVNYTEPMEYSTKLEYRKFGIDLGGLPPTTDERYYILILEKNDLRAIKRKAEDFVEAYLPTGATPTHFIINSKLSYQEMVDYTADINSLYPNCISFSDDISHREHVLEQERLLELEKKLQNVPKLDIEPYIRPLMELTWPYTEIFLNRLHECIENIKAVASPSQVLYYSGALKSQYDKSKLVYVAVHLQYYYGINTYLPAGYEDNFLHLYSSLMYNPNTLLVEDVVKYIKELPSFLVKTTSYGPYIFIIDNKHCSLQVEYCPLDGIESNTVTTKILNAFTTNIMPLSELYNLRSELTAETDHKELLDLLVQFEKKLKINNKFLNVTDVFFFEEDGILNIGHMKSLSFKAKAYVQPTVAGRPGFETTITENELYTLYPLEVFLDGRSYINKIKEFLSRTGKDVSMLSTKIHKHPYEYGATLPAFSIYRSADLRLPFLDFLTIGLYHLHCSTVRGGLYKTLLEDMTVRGIRDNSNAISAFGGFHPLLGNNLIITERLFTGGTVDV